MALSESVALENICIIYNVAVAGSMSLWIVDMSLSLHPGLYVYIHA